MRNKFYSALLMLLSPILLYSDTIRVPADYGTIQKAIDAADTGDVVLVALGYYVENIDFMGKAITVQSKSGPAFTTICGDSPTNPDHASCFTFRNGEGPDSVLQGITLKKGKGTLHDGDTHGGGVFCLSASPSINNNQHYGMISTPARLDISLSAVS
jgi:hypothetical protein